MTAVLTAFRTVTEVGYPWAQVNPDCYMKYYDMESFNAGQLSDLLLKYLQDHLRTRHFGIGLNMMKMLHDYYPVPKKCFKNENK
ncbi:TPA: hypothetical protein OUZ71_002704 [Legionella pneumophila]|nr:hypothetical protein [Legionella pneumophila]